MKNTTKIGVAIAGLGFGESVHMPALTSNNKADLLALWHPNSEKLNESCKRNDLRGYTDWEGLLNDQSIDAIVLTTPPSPRFSLAKQALEAGKHLLLEKPIALNAYEGEELQRIALEKNLSIAVNFEYRAVPLFMKLNRLINQNLIGDIWFIKFDWLMSSRANKSRPWNWYSNKDEGGGVIGALGTHAFDIIHWLFGPINKVNCKLSTSIPYRLCLETNKQKKVTSEDICLAQMEIKQIQNSKNIPVQMTLSAVTMKGRGCWIEIYGSKGTLIIGSDNQKDYVHGFGLWHAEKGGPLKSISADEDHAFKKTWKDGRIAPVARVQEWWLNSISQGKPIIPGLTEGVSSQKVADKIKESANSCTEISILSII